MKVNRWICQCGRVDAKKRGGLCEKCERSKAIESTASTLATVVALADKIQSVKTCASSIGAINQTDSQIRQAATHLDRALRIVESGWSPRDNDGPLPRPAYDPRGC